MNKLYIGVDIGGTSIVAARFSESEMLERTEVPTFEREKQPNCYQFTWIQFGLAVFWQIGHLVIDFAKYVNDNVFCSHGSSSCFLVLTPQV